MENEGTIIPYHSSDLTGKKALVFSPHPDDETIGCGGSLALHAAAGDSVKVVFLTDGAKGDSSGRTDRERYVALRQNEAKKACTCLGISDLEFWSYEDRGLAGSRGALRRVMDLLEGFRPELVYVPSPLEFHPDHRAACFLVCDAIQGCPFDFDVAFYEVGQPLGVNLLVDISGVIELKQKALQAYKSQLKEREYGDISTALNRFRSLTLPEGVTHAEAYSLWRSDIVRKMGPYGIPFQKVDRLAADPREAGPLVSIIVRTKDRPVLLANAVRSIAGQTYANLEIVVVNDGGIDVKDVVTAAAGDTPVTYIAHKKTKGRSAAANTGLKAARGVYLNFLDDDDVFYPDHVEALVSHIAAKHGQVVYSGALNVYYSGIPDRPETRINEELIYNLEFDSDILLFQSYIPIMSVLFSSEALSKVEGFSEDLVLFEDWDFWIRLSRHFPFYHLDKVTAEYRFYGSTNDEESHRQKYQYDDALASIFDRSLKLFNGKAWVRFLNNGSMGAFRSKMRSRGARFAELEEKLSSCQTRMQEKENSLVRADGLLKDKDRELQWAYEKLTEKNLKLQQTHAQLQDERVRLEMKDRVLNEIFGSKGWRWLTRLREIKKRLSFKNDIELKKEESATEGKTYCAKIIHPVNKQRPRVVHAIGNLMTGGSTRLVIDLIEHLGHKYDQEVITNFVPSPPAYTGFSYHDFSGPDTAERLTAFLQEKNVGILHIHYWGEPWYRKVFEAAENCSCAVIENINTPVAPFVMDTIQQYVYVSNYAMNYASPVTGKATVIYPGSDLKMFQRDGAPIPENAIGMAYRLEEDKLRQDSIRVFIEVVKKRPQTKAYIVGGGTLFDSYRDQVIAQGVAGNFVFTGYVAYEKLPGYYRKLSLFVAPVWSESFGQVSPFAMSMKIPVAGYNVGALPEILGSDECLGKDPAELAEIIIRLLDDRQKRIEIGAANYARACDFFSIENMIRKYDLLYSRLLK